MANFRSQQANQSAGKIFWIGTFLAVGLGLWFQNAFDNRRLDRWAQRTLLHARADSSVHYDRVGLSLSRAGLPTIALRVQNLVIESKSPCAFVREVHADELYLPLSLWGLVKKQLLIGVARIEGGRVRLVPTAHECGHGVVAGQLTALSNGQLDEKWVSSLSQQLMRLRQNWPVEAIRLSNVVWVWEGTKKPLEVQMNYFQVRQIQGDKPILWDGMAHMPEWLGVRGLPRLHVEGEWSSDRVEGHIRGHWKEGSLSLQARLEIEENKKAFIHGKVHIDHLPMSPVNQVLARVLELPDSGYETRPVVWMSCEADFASPIEALTTTNLQFKPCMIQGDLGEIQVSGLQFGSIFSPKPMGELKLDIKEMPVSYLREIMGWKVPFAGFSQHWGWFEGQLWFDLLERENLRGRGVWHNFNWAGLIEGRQNNFTVNSAQLDLTIRKDTTEAQLNNIQIGQEKVAKLAVSKNRNEVVVRAKPLEALKEKQYFVYDWGGETPRLEVLPQKRKTSSTVLDSSPVVNDKNLARVSRGPWALVQWILPSLGQSESGYK